jgi:phosphoribosylamine--glycine ligase
MAAARGQLQPDPSLSAASTRHALCVVLAAPGYPADPRLGGEIRGLDEAGALEGVRVYHAGTSVGPRGPITAGGRVLAVTGVGATLPEAHRRAYDAVAVIDFDGKQLRRDIAHTAPSRAVASPGTGSSG